MKPLLAHVYEPHRVTYPCYVQPKLNGIRALYQNGCFQSREQLPFHRPVLSHISEVLVGIFRPETILDGELYVHGWPLQRINGAVTPVRLQPTEDTLKVQYHIFDKVNFNHSFIERYESVYTTPAVAFGVETKLVNSAAEADALYAYWVAAGYEGMMYRLGDCPYTDATKGKQLWSQLPFQRPSFARSKFANDQDNRAWHLLKRKDWQDDEFDFVSLNDTVGEKGERGFQLWCKKKSGRQFKVSSGLTNAELDHYLSNPPVGKQIKVKYLVLSNEGIPLNATILAIL